MKVLFVTCYEPKEFLIPFVEQFVEIGYQVEHYPLFQYQYDTHDALINWKEHFKAMVDHMVPDILFWVYLSVSVEDFCESTEYARDVWNNNRTAKTCLTFSNCVLSLDEPSETWEALQLSRIAPFVDVAFSSCPENCRKFLSCGATYAFHVLPGVDTAHVKRTAFLEEQGLWEKLRAHGVELSRVPIELIENDEPDQELSAPPDPQDICEEFREYFNVESKYHCDVAFVCNNLWLDDKGPLLGTTDIPEDTLINTWSSASINCRDTCRQLVPRAELLDLLCGRVSVDTLNVQASRLLALKTKGKSRRYTLPTDSLSIAIYGPGYLAARYPNHYRGYPKYEDRWQIALGSRLIVCTHSDADRKNGLYIDQDFVLAQGFGGLVLCDPIAQLRTMFKPSVHTFTFRSLEPRARYRPDGSLRSRGELLLDVCEEISSRVAWSIANPQENFHMRRRGQQVVLQQLSVSRLVCQVHKVFVERATRKVCQGADKKLPGKSLARSFNYQRDIDAKWKLANDNQYFIPEMSDRFNAKKYLQILSEMQLSKHLETTERSRATVQFTDTSSLSDQALWEHWVRNPQLNIRFPRCARETLLKNPAIRAKERKKSQTKQLFHQASREEETLDLSNFEKLQCETQVLRVFMRAKFFPDTLGDSLVEMEVSLRETAQTHVGAQYVFLERFFSLQ